MYNTNSDIKICDYGDSYKLVKETITIAGARDDAVARQGDERNKGVIFKNCATIINCKSEINNAEIDDAKDNEIVMPIYNDNLPDSDII